MFVKNYYFLLIGFGMFLLFKRKLEYEVRKIELGVIFFVIFALSN